MNKQQNVNPKDLAVLSKINITEIINIEKKDEFLENFEKMTWSLFFETDAKDLTEEELEILEKFVKQKDFKGAVKYLEEKFKNIKVLLMKNALLAKKYFILQAFAKDNVNGIKKDGEDRERFEELKKLAKEDKWEEFMRVYNM